MTRLGSLLGDTIGVACLFAMMIGLQFLPLVFDAPQQPEWEQGQ